MNPKLEKVLEDHRVGLIWAHEAATQPKSNGWSRAGDSRCSRKLGCVSVPRRRQDWQLFANVLHEVAHLERWRTLGISPAQEKGDLEVCRLALEIGRKYGFNRATIARLERDVAEQIAPEEARP